MHQPCWISKYQTLQKQHQYTSDENSQCNVSYNPRSCYECSNTNSGLATGIC